jgi:predicted nucleic acid-binding Zn ribbon protein
MPLYLLRCECGHETTQRCRYEDKTTCPCGKEMQRIPATCSFNLTGDGWYKGGRQ